MTIKPSKIGLGTIRYFKKKINKKLEIKMRLESFELAYSLGINFFDTADSYENGESEKILSKFIHGKRSKVFLATKYSPRFSKFSEIKKACDNSLKRLKTDYIDLYQLHWPNPEFDFEDQIISLNKLFKYGKIRNIGLSNCTTNQIVSAKKILGNKLYSHQDKLNLLTKPDDFKKGYLKLLKYHNLKNISYGVFGQGFLRFSKKQKNFLDKILKNYNMNLSQFIISWIYKYDKNGHILTNSLDKEHIIQNITASKQIISDKDFLKVRNFFKMKIQNIDINKIRVVSWDIDKSHKIYTNLKDAVKNKYNLKPSIEFLVEEIKVNGFKPIELKKSKNFYYVMQGRMRFWAYRFLYKEKKTIPSIILF